MVQIFIEAKKRETSECVFLEALIRKYVPAAVYTINPVDGWTNLCQMAHLMTMQENQDSGGNNLVIFDADYARNGGGYENRFRTFKNNCPLMELTLPFSFGQTIVPTEQWKI